MNGYHIPDEEEISKRQPELLAYSARWCDFCKLDVQTEAEELVHEAIVALYNRKCPKDCPQIAFLKKTIKQATAIYKKKGDVDNSVTD